MINHYSYFSKTMCSQLTINCSLMGSLKDRKFILTFRYLTLPFWYFAAVARSLQSCLTLCDPIDGSPSGFPVPGTLQARTLEWVAISFSNAWKWKVKVKSLSRVQLVTPWTAAYQAPPSMGFSRQKYWSGVPLPSPIWYFSFLKCLKVGAELQITATVSKS